MTDFHTFSHPLLQQQQQLYLAKYNSGLLNAIAASYPWFIVLEFFKYYFAFVFTTLN